jgi:proteasome alpha subunit
MDIFEKEFADGMTFEAAAKLGLKALSAAIEEPLSSASVEIGVVEKDKKFRRLAESEIVKLIGKA